MYASVYQGATFHLPLWVGPWVGPGQLPYSPWGACRDCAVLGQLTLVSLGPFPLSGTNRHPRHSWVSAAITVCLGINPEMPASPGLWWFSAVIPHMTKEPDMNGPLGAWQTQVGECHSPISSEREKNWLRGSEQCLSVQTHIGDWEPYGHSLSLGQTLRFEYIDEE